MPKNEHVEPPLPEIVGTATAMQDVYRLVRLAAPKQANVLLIGETGTGKEIIAKAVHKLSKRSDGPFIRVNCGALHENLLESELFGHIKGSFTGAVENKTGPEERSSPFADTASLVPVLLKSTLSAEPIDPLAAIATTASVGLLPSPSEEDYIAQIDSRTGLPIAPPGF